MSESPAKGPMDDRTPSGGPAAADFISRSRRRERRGPVRLPTGGWPGPWTPVVIVAVALAVGAGVLAWLVA